MLTSSDFNLANNPNFYYVGEKVIVEEYSTITGKTEYKSGTVYYDNYIDINPWEREITVNIGGIHVNCIPSSVRQLQ